VKAQEETKVTEEIKVTADDATVLLFTTKTCPNCKVAASLLDKAGVAYTKLLVEENMEAVKEYDFKNVPTLIVKSGENFAKYSGVPEIKKFLA